MYPKNVNQFKIIYGGSEFKIITQYFHQRCGRRSCGGASLDIKSFYEICNFNNWDFICNFIYLFFTCFSVAILIALVLIQQGKGADMGAAFGSGSAGSFGIRIHQLLWKRQPFSL